MRVNNHAPMPVSGTAIDLKIYFDRNTLMIDSGAPGGDMWACFGAGSGKRVGLRRREENTRPIYFDSFFASDHFVKNPACPDRGCRCGSTACLPNELTAIMQHLSGDAAPQIGESEEFTLYRRCYRDGYKWFSDPGVPGYDYMMAGPECFVFIFSCSSESTPGQVPIDQYLLTWSCEHSPCEAPDCWEGEAASYPIASQTAEPVSAVCDALSVVYDLDMRASTAVVPRHYDEEDVDYTGPGGIYRLTITE
jgi:hypothetical protein